MDAKSRRRRESTLSPREQRWSMSAQTLERIVAELMKPLSNCRQSFDRDDSGLLEEYLTAAGLRALAAAEAGEPAREPNYLELALVIQSCSLNYGRKVDTLSRLVIDFNHQLTDDLSAACDDSREESPRSVPAAGRVRAASQGAGGGEGAGLPFAVIALVASAGARRDAAPGTPPPTLPRGYAELRPREPLPGRRLYEYDAVGDENIGTVDDFLLARRLHNGFLMEELDSGGGAGEGAGARGMSLLELQAACARAAAPPPLGPPPSPPPSASPPASPPPPTAPPTPPMPPPAALRRKRRSEVRIEDMMPGSFSFEIDESIRGFLSTHIEFSVDERWIRRVVRHRRDAILCARRDAPPTILGFPGWEASEALSAALAAKRGAARLAALERGEWGSEHDEEWGAACSPLSEGLTTEKVPISNGPRERQLDPAELARDVRSALPAVSQCVSWSALAAAAGRTQSTGLILYDVLKKACEGEVEIVLGDALSLGTFSVRVLTEARAVRLDDEDWQLLTGVKRRLSPPPPRPATLAPTDTAVPPSWSPVPPPEP